MQMVSKKYNLTIKNQAGNVLLTSEVEMNLKSVTTGSFRRFFKLLKQCGLSLTRENLKQVYYSELPLENPESTYKVALDLDSQESVNSDENSTASVTENLLDSGTDVCKDFQLPNDFIDALLRKKSKLEKILAIGAILSVIFMFVCIGLGIGIDSYAFIIIGCVCFLLIFLFLNLKCSL